MHNDGLNFELSLLKLRICRIYKSSQATSKYCLAEIPNFCSDGCQNANAEIECLSATCIMELERVTEKHSAARIRKYRGIELAFTPRRLANILMKVYYGTWPQISCSKNNMCCAKRSVPSEPKLA